MCYPVCGLVHNKNMRLIPRACSELHFIYPVCKYIINLYKIYFKIIVFKENFISQILNVFVALCKMNTWLWAQ